MLHETSPPRRCRSPLVRHELLDAYWFARAFLYRALRVASAARCASTIGHRIDVALRRTIRCIIDAADGTPEKADERLRRACAAIGVALTHFEEMSVERGVVEVVFEDLREHAALLLERLQMLEGKPLETWSSSNCLRTVVAEAANPVEGSQSVDVVTAVAKLSDAAVRELPQSVVSPGRVAHPPVHPGGRTSGSGADGKDEKVPKPPTP